MKNEWTLVTKEAFQEFNKKNFLAIVNHRKDFKFYGNASHIALSKMNIKTKEYYIISSRIETPIKEERFFYEIEVENLKNGNIFLTKDDAYGINEIEAYKVMCEENLKLDFEVLNAKVI